MSFELATIDCSVPDLDFDLESCVVKDFDHEKVAKVFQKFEFVSLLKRLPGATPEAGVATKEKTVKTNFEKFKVFNFLLLLNFGPCIL